MITTGLINIAYYILSWLISLLPTGGTLPSQVHTASTALGGYLGIVAPIVPTGTLLTVLSLLFSIQIAFFGWRTVKWIISYIPAVGGNG